MTIAPSPDFLSRAISRIYDCAVDPTGWDDTLTFVRDEMQFAFVSMQFIAFPESYPDTPPQTQMFRTEWDQAWLDGLQPLISDIPLIDRMFNADIDVPMNQLSLMDESDFQASDFYTAWVQPQGLCDTLNTNLLKRDNMTALLSAPTYQGRASLGDLERGIIREFAPHLRRALLIGDMLDEKKAQMQMLRNVLDHLAIGVLLVEGDGRISYANAAGEDVLSEGAALSTLARKLHVPSQAHRAGFMTAIARACSGDDLDLQNWGNGIALPRAEGAPVLAYVLPLGQSERRQSLGPGMAAVFLAADGAPEPPSVEVVAAVTGLTTAEARIALQIAGGATPQDISEQTGVSVHTVRKHLSNAFDKTGHRNQASLSGAIGRLTPPV
ncbi:MAG: LuxR C-terminal-related transcriptional regulator [Pseudomonadota bacterium]